MDARNDLNESLKDLAQRAASLRAAIARMRDELASVNAAEQELVERLRTLGLADDLVFPPSGEEDESKTTVDRIAAGLPKRPRAGLRTTLESSTLKAGAAGAGLMLGLAVLILLAVNLGASRSAAPAPAVGGASTPATTAFVTTPVPPIDRDIPPPPPQGEAPAPTPSIVGSASAPAPAPSPPPSPAVVAKAPASPPIDGVGSAPGTMTVICTPKCDTITDNNVPLAPSSVVNLPVAAGSHKLVLSAPNGARKTMFVNVTPGQPREVRVAMDAPRDYGF